MNKEHILEFCDKLFKLQDEYGMYIRSTSVYDFNENLIGNISYDNWDGYNNAFYTVRYLDMDSGELSRYKYEKRKH